MFGSSKKPLGKANVSQADDLEKAALKEKVAILEGIQYAMPDPYYVRDMDYNIVIWPEAIAKLTGFSEAEAKTLKCHQIFKACVCPPNSACPTQNCIQTRQFLKDVAVDVYHKTGKTIHSLVSNAGVYNEDGKPIAAVEVVKNNTTIKASMDSIGETIKSIDTQANSLSSILEQINSISERINSSAQETTTKSKMGVQASHSMSEKVEQSTRHADDVRVKMQKINDAMLLSVEKINNLEKKTEDIVKSVAIIQDIASETNLLAINAAIQAVHAGEAGRGFKVVAEGIKELSQNSSESALAITQTIQEIIELIKETITSLNATEKSIETGTQNIADLLAFISAIDGAMQSVSEIMNVMESEAADNYKLGTEQKSTVVEMKDISKELASISGRLTEEFDRVMKAIQHIDM